MKHCLILVANTDGIFDSQIRESSYDYGTYVTADEQLRTVIIMPYYTPIKVAYAKLKHHFPHGMQIADLLNEEDCYITDIASLSITDDVLLFETNEDLPVNARVTSSGLFINPTDTPTIDFEPMSLLIDPRKLYYCVKLLIQAHQPLHFLHKVKRIGSITGTVCCVDLLF